MATARSVLDGTNGQTHATWRNGYRERALDTRLGTLNLKVPKPRQGNYAPGFPEPRKTSETAPVAVIQEACSGDVSPRRVDALAQAMGVSGISKSTVSNLCRDIAERGTAFLDRPLTGDGPSFPTSKPPNRDLGSSGKLHHIDGRNRVELGRARSLLWFPGRDQWTILAVSFRQQCRQCRPIKFLGSDQASASRVIGGGREQRQNLVFLL